MSSCNAASSAVSAMVRRMKPPASSSGTRRVKRSRSTSRSASINTLRNADMLFLGQIHQHATGNRNLRRQTRALGANRVLDHLHQQGSGLRSGPSRWAAFTVAASPIRACQISATCRNARALQADIDEGRLHPGQDTAPRAQDRCCRPEPRARLCARYATPARSPVARIANRVSCGVKLMRILSAIGRMCAYIFAGDYRILLCARHYRTPCPRRIARP